MITIDTVRSLSGRSVKVVTAGRTMHGVIASYFGYGTVESTTIRVRYHGSRDSVTFQVTDLLELIAD